MRFLVGEAIVLAATGALAGPRIRAVILRHSVAGVGATRCSCPNCLHPILPVGWRGLAVGLSITGRCPACRARVGPGLGSVELTAAALFGLLAVQAGPLPVLAGSWLIVCSLALTAVDARVHRLPDMITLPTSAGLLLLLGATAARSPQDALLRAMLGAVVLAGCYVILALSSPAGLGFGDCKLAFALGAALGWIGWPALVLATFLGFALAAISGLTLVLLGRATRRSQIAFGPFMMIGAWAVLIQS